MTKQFLKFMNFCNLLTSDDFRSLCKSAYLCGYFIALNDFEDELGKMSSFEINQINDLIRFFSCLDLIDHQMSDGSKK